MHLFIILIIPKAKDYINHHSSDVTWVLWCLKPLATWLFVQCLVQANIEDNMNTQSHWLLVPCEQNLPVTIEFHSWRFSNAVIFSMSWSHDTVHADHIAFVCQKQVCWAYISYILLMLQDVITYPWFIQKYMGAQIMSFYWFITQIKLLALKSIHLKHIYNMISFKFIPSSSVALCVTNLICYLYLWIFSHQWRPVSLQIPLN